MTRRLVGTVHTVRRDAAEGGLLRPDCDRCPHVWGEHQAWGTGQDAVEITCPLCACLMIVRFGPPVVVEEYPVEEDR